MPRRNKRQPTVYARPVPTASAGSWLASPRGFFVDLRLPRQAPMERFNRVRTADIGANGTGGGIISGSGAATVSVGPQGYGTRWYPAQISIATQSGANDASTCSFFLNVIGPGGFLGQSYSGGGDQPGFGLPTMQPGDLLYAVWAGGHSGDWCQVTVTGSMDLLVP